MKKTCSQKKKMFKMPFNSVSILKKITLNLENPDFSSKYDVEAKQVTLHFLKIFLIFALVHSLFLEIKLIIQANYSRMIMVGAQALFYIIPLIYQRHFLKLKKLTIDVIFCLIIVLIYIIHIEFILIPFISVPQDPFGPFFLGVAIELFKIFLYIAKIRWSFFCISNLLMNGFLLWHLFQNPKFDLSLFPVILGLFIIPLLLIFLKEKNEKTQFEKQKNYEKFIKSYENLIQTMIPDPILILDSSKSEIMFCNEATHSIFQTKKLDQILNQLAEIEISVELNKTTNLLDIYQNHLNQVILISDYENYEGVFNNKSCIDSIIPPISTQGLNRQYYFNIKFINIYWREKKSFLIILNDTTSSFNYEKMKEITQYKDKILATFSHDLRSPLSGIVGMLEIAKEFEGLDEKIKDVLIIALNSAKILKFLVNDIIDFSFVTKKQLTLIRTHEKIRNPINEVIEIVEHQIKEKGLKFIKEIPEEILNSSVYIDLNRTKQILLNLLINAIKFTYTGFIKIKVSIDSLEKLAKIAIEDTGIGIPEENLEQLFTLFEKNDTKDLLNNHRAGLGFGLVISQALASQLCPMEKGISVQSSVGKGSEFRFSMPLSDQISDCEIASERIDTKSPMFKNYNMKIQILSDNNIGTPKSQNYLKKNPGLNKILLVDDDMINIMVHSQYLKKFQLDFDIAFNGKEAIDKIKEKSLNFIYYSIVLMDCNMPIMDGFQASEKIQEMIKSREILNLKIIAVTANASIKDIEQCQKAGMSYFLEKPVSIDKLKEVLERMLKINIDHC